MTGDVVDIGPHIFHSEYHNMMALLRRLGTDELICWQRGKVLTVASKPGPTVLRHYPLPAPLSLAPSILGAPGLGMHDYLSMLPTGWRGMRFGEEQVPELDRISGLDYFRSLGVTRRPDRLVVALRLDGGHQCAARTGISRFPDAHPRHVPARQVVSALPPQDLAAVLPRAWKSRAPFDVLARFEPSPYVCVYLWFDRDIKAGRFATHLWSPGRLNYDFYDLSQIRKGWRGRPTVIASNIIYSHRAHHLSDAEIVRRTVAELGEIAPRAARARLLHADVHRVPMAIPCPTVGFEAMRPKSRSPIPGLTLAGDWTRTRMPCTMEGAAKSGYIVAETVLAERGIRARLAIEARLYDDLAGLARAAVPGRSIP